MKPATQKISLLLIGTVFGLSGLFGFGPLTRSAQAGLGTPDSKYVRTANYYLKAGTDIRPEHYDSLSSYDLLVLPAEAQVYNRGLFSELRKRNPDIVILAYVPSKSWNYAWVDSLHQRLGQGIQDSWWLLDPSGNRVSVWPGTSVINGVSGWSSYLPQFVDEQIWSTGLWDGIFYDEFSATISWLNGGNLDLHRDGLADDRQLMDVAWKRSMRNLLQRTRERLGSEAVIITNGDSDSELQPYVNGRMFESFPTPWEGDGTWSASIGSYRRVESQIGYPSAVIINANTNNTGQNANWREVRYALCSTLLGDGFFSYDFGEQDHGQLWHYDEYDVSLGQPLGPPVNLTTGQSDVTQPGLWRRDFENGVSLVNSTGVVQSANLGIEMERIRGSQDSSTNDGRLAAAVSLPPWDGLVLLKPLDRLVGAGFPNGAFARVFDESGNKVRNGFFAYVRPYRGGSQLILDDLDGDSQTDTVSAYQGLLTVSLATGGKKEFRPYGDAYRDSLSLATADFDQDGQLEIVTAPGPGHEPLIQVFKLDGSLLSPGFYAYSRDFTGGVNVAAADLYGNGWPVIVAGAGPGGGPHVRIFNSWGKSLYHFMAYDWRFRGGVNVAIGDFDGNGGQEIATGAGPGGGPHVRIFSKYGGLLNPGFFAADPSSRTGVVVAAHDVDGDGTDEIISLSTDVFELAAYGQ